MDDDVRSTDDVAVTNSINAGVMNAKVIKAINDVANEMEAAYSFTNSITYFTFLVAFKSFTAFTQTKAARTGFVD